MSYVGNIPAEKYSSLTQQTFSSPTGTNFVLSQSVTNSTDIALFVDNVRQDPTTYTAVGTALTTSTISSPSTMYCLYNGRTTETISPASGSVDSSHLVAGSVDDSHISGLAASKLTGSLPASMNEITKSSSAPTVSTNPAGGVGTVYLNTTSGEMFSLTDATAGANVWSPVVPYSYMSATGGTITTDGDFKVHTFNSSGTFTPTIGDAPTVGDVVEYLVAAGGGAGSYHSGAGGGGGGAGGYRTATGFTVTSVGLTVTIGAGGATAASLSKGGAGTNSVFDSITSTSGSGGGPNAGVSDSGGSTGGSSYISGTAGAVSPAGQGNIGGPLSAGGGGAGGGGAGAAGTTNSTAVGGVGGVGLSNSITGTAVYRSGGGGGGGNGNVGGAGGNGGGGAGNNNSTNAIAGTANTGGGGGAGGYNSGASAAGGSGVVIIRYQFQA